MDESPTLWRVRNDTSGLERPEFLVRRLVEPERFEATVAFYERVAGVACQLRFEHPAAGLRLATVGSVLVIGGPEPALAAVRETDFTVVVASLDAVLADLVDPIAPLVEVVAEPRVVPTGRNMRLRHPDGALMEYVEHRPGPDGA